MAERKYTHGLKLTEDGRTTVISIGTMEIWDGADLSLLRDTLFEIVGRQGCDSFAVDMQDVLYVPSGFFGMLYDWLERGVEVKLYNPRARVKNMLWFRKFFTPEATGKYRLHTGAAVNEDACEELWPGLAPAQVHESRLARTAL